MAGAVNLRYLILGLLAQRPMSGYDVKRFLKSLSWLIGSPSSGSLYPILRTLLRENLVSQEVIPGLDRPPRKIYSITDAGRQVLQAWVDEPVKAGASLKAFVMRLLIADHFSRTALANHLQQRQTQIADCQTALEKMTEAPGQEGDFGQRLALSYGLALAAGELAWLDYTLGQLPEQPFSEEDERAKSTI
jgi:PadR family transcriptional regulator AphA